MRGYPDVQFQRGSTPKIPHENSSIPTAGVILELYDSESGIRGRFDFTKILFNKNLSQRPLHFSVCVISSNTDDTTL